MRRTLIVFAGVGALLLSAGAGPALAQGQQLCIGGRSKPVFTPGSSGTCNRGYTLTTLATESEVTSLQSTVSALRSDVSALQTKLSKVSYTDSGLNNLPTLTITGANLQIVNGNSESRTDSTNGLGNLIIGYDGSASAANQTGSHNLILGDIQKFTSYGGITGGEGNILSGPFSAVFGTGNTASGKWSSVTGGQNGVASGDQSSVSGGYGNTASKEFSSVSGGIVNAATGLKSSVSGGESNTASGEMSSISGGVDNAASGDGSSILGGAGNTASGQLSAILGGANNTVSTAYGTSP